MCNETLKESVWCQIQLKKSKLLVGVCYRVPDATEEANQGMYKLLERANKLTSLIMGDLIGKIQKGRENRIDYSWILLRPVLCNNMLWSQPEGTTFWT